MQGITLLVIGDHCCNRRCFLLNIATAVNGEAIGELVDCDLAVRRTFCVLVKKKRRALTGLCVFKNRGCDWRCDRRTRRRDFAPSLPRGRGHADREPHTGRALAALGYGHAQVSWRTEV